MDDGEFKKFCMAQNEGQEASEQFVGIKFSGGKPQVYFPYGCFRDFENVSDEELRGVFSCLMNVLSDHCLMDAVENSHYASSLEFETKLDFPLQEFFVVLEYYLNFGLFKETEKIYKQGVHGKINWSRTIKHTRPQVLESGRGAEFVYLDMVSSCPAQNENQLVTLIHEFCVAQAQRLVGPLYGVETDVESSLDFDYELFSSVLQEKLSRTFNDRKCRFFGAMKGIVEYLQGNLVDGTLMDCCYGVSSFAPVWEKMLDRIFGNLSEGESKDLFNPHCEWRLAGGLTKNADDKKFAMRPDTIMRRGEELFIVDAKFYTRNNLPSSSSISKQIVYAEYAEKKKLAEGEQIFNVFLLPFCSEGEGSAPYEMNYLGTAVADWVDGTKPYHQIVGIRLDVKSVLKNCRRDEIAQYKLAELVKNVLVYNEKQGLDVFANNNVALCLPIGRTLAMN
ncbi:LlaJI family restriction endonuclease [Fibrobacter intestinalis]|uniref:LlaJI restriction endonuclease n=1 Tax=Fibrobacter intestinalis TaxID=28122 RepID=A0A1T4K8L5_9BACT|nr:MULTISPECIES: LlaJI family restriction endonuclease [Fibrobacter]PBC74952.1 LlaJI restriction endonuclease [Fibrobacter sp. NR9]SJZ38749.1 LlaJI restriction endonuclease [Fibrobacter intestinalis]